MRTIGIFYFSGTGNTEIIANMISEHFLKEDYSVDLIRIEDVLKRDLKIDLQKYEMIGIGSQVIGYSAPNLVNSFIKRLPKGNGIKAFIFRTAGGVAPINYNASKPMIRKLKRKGYDVFYERVFSLGSNWIRKFDDNVVKQLYEAAKRKTGLMCQGLIKGERQILETNLKLKLLMGLAAEITPPLFRIIGKDLKVDKSCTHCGLCTKNCPAGNIYEKDDKIKFKMSCSCCMRCVYSCPNKAIKYKKLNFFQVEGGYNIEKTLESPSNLVENVNKQTPPFFKPYIENDAI